MAKTEVDLKILLDINDSINGLKKFQSEGNDTFKQFSKDAKEASKKANEALSLIKFAEIGHLALEAGHKLLEMFEAPIEAAREAEVATRKLANALKLSGDSSGETVSHFNELAESLSKITKFDDDVIKGQISYVLQLGATKAQTEQLITTATKLAELTGGDLNSAVTQLTATYSGSTKGLATQFGALKNLTQAQLASGEAVRIVNEQLKTSGGSLTGLDGAYIGISKSIHDFTKELGKAVTDNGFLESAIRAATSAIHSMTEAVKFLGQNKDVVIRLAAAIATIAISANFGLLVTQVKALGAAFATLTTSINASKIAVQLFKVAATFGLALIIDQLVQIGLKTNSVGGFFDLLGQNIKLALLNVGQFIIDMVSKLAELGSSLPYVGDEFKLIAATTKNISKDLDELKKETKINISSIEIKEVKNNIEAAAHGLGRAKDNADGLGKALKDANLKEANEKLNEISKKFQGAGAGKIASIINASNIEIAEVERVALKDIRVREKAESIKAQIRIKAEQDVAKEIISINEKIKASGTGKLFEDFKPIKDNEGVLISDSKQKEAQNIQQGGQALGFVSEMLKGAQGAVNIATQGVTLAATAFLGPAGAIAGEIFGVLAQGPDKVREMLTQFFDAIPVIINNLILAIPEFIRVLAQKIPEILIPLANQMPFIATRFGFELIKNIPAIVKGFVEEFAKQIKTVGGLLPSGGGGGGGLLGGITSGIGKIFKFAEGGFVPGSGFGDTVPSLLTPGELVIDRSSAKDLAGFLESQKSGAISSDALDKLTTVLNKSGGSQTMQINLVIGEKQLADVILNLNRNGFRTA